MTERGKYLRMYTMTEDSGFAPHVKDRWISLACCAGPTRKNAKTGDWVLGISGKTMMKKSNVPYHTLIYLMKVEKKLTFDKYFYNTKFHGRVDNFYKKGKDDNYIRDKKTYKEICKEVGFEVHKNEDDTKKSKHVLLSTHFYYFGDCWKDKNNKKIQKLKKKIRNFCNAIKPKKFTYTTGGNYKKIPIDDKKAKVLLKFIRDNYKVGKEYGEPNHLLANNQKPKCYKQ